MVVCRVTEGQQPTLMFMCPACKLHHSVWVGFSDSSWQWNGSLSKPTIRPSIRVESPRWVPEVTPENLAEWQKKHWPQHKVTGICHSFVTDGRIEFLDDCTHAMAGQTVSLPEIER